jgi:hypothetical protein
VGDVKTIIQLFPHSSQHVTGNSSHSLSDAPFQIIDIRTLRDFLSIRTQDMDLVSVVFVKQIFEGVNLFLNNPVYFQVKSLECYNKKNNCVISPGKANVDDRRSGSRRKISFFEAHK